MTTNTITIHSIPLDETGFCSKYRIYARKAGVAVPKQPKGINVSTQPFVESTTIRMGYGIYFPFYKNKEGETELMLADTEAILHKLFPRKPKRLFVKFY